MPLKVKNICEIMNKIAPLSLKEDYDNVGLMAGEVDNEITNILIALDCTLQVIAEAINENCNMIITHHPLLFIKPSSITSETLVGKKIIKLLENNISLYSSHTNLDIVSGGINDIIMKVLDIESSKVLLPLNTKLEETKYGTGRIGELKSPMLLGDLCEYTKEKLSLPAIRYIGDDNKEIRKIAVINGSGEKYIESAIKQGADCVITGETSYHLISDFNERNIAVIDAGHFNTEWPAMKFVSEKIQQEIENMDLSNRVVLSTTSKNPYKYR